MFRLSLRSQSARSQNDSSAFLNPKCLKVRIQLWTEFFIFHISIRINCNRISEGLLYPIFVTIRYRWKGGVLPAVTWRLIKSAVNTAAWGFSRKEHIIIKQNAA
jgi:hypothetical protein